MDRNTLNIIALILVIIGAINWALVGLFGFNLVAFLCGNYSIPARIIYTLVGAAGIYLAYVTRFLVKLMI